MASRLIVVRHAKADYPLGTRDRDRPLSSRGQRDARAASGWLRDQALVVGSAEAVVSSALRTQQTWDLVGRHLTEVVRSDEPRLYDASVAEALALAAEATAQTVIVVGHNPTMHGVVMEMAGSGDADALGIVAGRFPTCTIAVLDLADDAPWAPGSATLTHLHIARADQ